MPERSIEAIAAQLSEDMRELNALVKAMRKAQRRRWVALVLAMIPLVAAIAFTVGYVRYSNNQADQRWCSLLSSTDQPLPKNLPDTEQVRRQRKVLAQIHELRLSLHCS